MSSHVRPATLLQFQMATKLILLMLSCSNKRSQPRYASLSEAKASDSHRMWAEVSSLTAHLLHSSPSRWRCLLRVLCPLRGTITALDWVLLKDWILALAPGLGPEISSLSILSLGITKTSPSYPVLVGQPPTKPFFYNSSGLPGPAQV